MKTTAIQFMEHFTDRKISREANQPTVRNCAHFVFGAGSGN